MPNLACGNLEAGIFIVSLLFAFTSCVEKWNMHERCGQHLEGYGGEIYFDASKLPPHTATCTVTIVGNGTEGYMLSLFFTSYNVSSDCMANITLREAAKHDKGLYQSFCKDNPYLNEYLIYTTNDRFLSLIYTRHVSNKPVAMTFRIKYVTFVSRVTGCTKAETKYQNMFSCRTGRCVHKSLLCKDLNPCGDHRDCVDGEVLTTEEDGQGMNFLAVLIVAGATVFAVFAIIQVSLVMRNERNLCVTKDPDVKIEAELMTISNVEVRKPENTKTVSKEYKEDTDSGTASDKEAASENLITREPA